MSSGERPHTTRSPIQSMRKSTPSAPHAHTQITKSKDHALANASQTTRLSNITHVTAASVQPTAADPPRYPRNKRTWKIAVNNKKRQQVGTR